MEIQNYERTQLDVSRKELLKQAIDGLGLRCVVDKVDAYVAISALYDPAGSLVSEGAGKGFCCDIGATAEAIEHYCLQMEGGNETCLYPSKFISLQESVLKDGVIRNLSNFDGLLECVEFKAVYGDGKVIIPKILVSPEDDIQASPDCLFLERYSTNSGSAFGCTFEEAILHGVNEVLERHVLSLVMLDIVDESSLVKVNKLSSEFLDSVFLSVDLAFSEETRVYYVSDVFGGFFCLAVRDCQEEDFLLPQIGSGCSQSFTLALTRAVFELRQAEALYGYEERLVDEQAARIMSKSKRLEGLRSLYPRRIFSSDEMPSLIDVNSQQPARQLEEIIRRLNANGFEVYYRVVRKINSSSVVTQVYIPGMERLNLIRSGKWVAPQKALLKPFL
ncbi:YcaO-like family protein [Pseudomonas sp. MOB-449]|nr:YcaO-like family protein [Pseudomonas sp. MOB-449]